MSIESAGAPSVPAPAPERLALEPTAAGATTGLGDRLRRAFAWAGLVTLLVLTVLAGAHLLADVGAVLGIRGGWSAVAGRLAPVALLGLVGLSLAVLVDVASRRRSTPGAARHRHRGGDAPHRPGRHLLAARQRPARRARRLPRHGRVVPLARARLHGSAHGLLGGACRSLRAQRRPATGHRGRQPHAGPAGRRCGARPGPRPLRRPRRCARRSWAMRSGRPARS